MEAKLQVKRPRICSAFGEFCHRHHLFIGIVVNAGAALIPMARDREKPPVTAQEYGLTTPAANRRVPKISEIVASELRQKILRGEDI